MWSRSCCCGAIGSLELFHERYERINRRRRTCVVNTGSHPTNQAVALQAIEPSLNRFLHELLLEILRWRAEAHVHARPAVCLGGAAEKVACVQIVVQSTCLGLIELRHSREATLRLDPLEHLAHDVDRESR